MPDTTPWNASSDSIASIKLFYHPTRPSTDEDTNVTDAWATHDFYAIEAPRVVNAYGVEIPHALTSYETGDIGDPTIVVRDKYFPVTADEKAILDELVTRKVLVYEAIPAAPA
jgi:hypothetical protein